MEVSQTLAHAFWGRALVAVEWRRPCFIAYEVDPALLAAELPPSLSLDLWRGRALVSLSLWEARYAKVFGFALSRELVATEIALRYHAHEGPRRGTVTLREYGSSALATFAARALFREPARACGARSCAAVDDQSVRCEYELELAGRAHRVRVRAGADAQPPAPGSLANFLVRRPYGYARSPRGTLLRYDLEHPPWRIHVPLEHQLDLDFAALFGPAWGCLDGLQPIGIVVADGSLVRASLPE